MKSPNTSSADPIFRELTALQDAESDLGRRYMQLQRAKNPSRALRVRFVAELSKLQSRVETLDRVLRVSEQSRLTA